MSLGRVRLHWGQACGALCSVEIRNRWWSGNLHVTQPFRRSALLNVLSQEAISTVSAEGRESGGQRILLGRG